MGTSLKSYPTVNLAIDTLAVITIGNDDQSWRLDPGVVNPVDPTQLSPADYNVVTNNKHWQLVSVEGTGGGAGGGDITQLINGQAYIDVTFAVTQSDTTWEFTELQVYNTVDSSPLNISPGIVTSKTTTGFRLQLIGVPNSNNYYLHWSFTGTGGAAAVAPPATTYSLSGPSSGTVGTPSTAFTVQLPGGTSVAAPVTVTPSAGGGGGTFTPTSVTLTTVAPSATFTYTAASAGTKTISTTNSGGLTDPAGITFTANAGFSTTYTLTGPSSGTVSVPSTNFTVALPGGGSVSGTVTVTPSDSSGGGTFTPTTVNLTTGAPSATFTYTPASIGTKTISVTNSGGLTNPGSLTYTVAAFDPSTITGLKVWLKADALALSDGANVNPWTDSSGNANNFVTAGGSVAPIYKTAIVNSKPVVRFNGTTQGLNNGVLSIGGNHTIFLVASAASISAGNHFLFDAGSAGADAIIIRREAADLKHYQYTGSFPVNVDTGGIAAGVWNYITADWNGTNIHLWRNGALKDTTGCTTLVSSGLSNSIGWSWIGVTGYFDGDIAEVLVYDSALSSTDRGNVHAYLATKYGL